jgi:hypothetical protein
MGLDMYLRGRRALYPLGEDTYLGQAVQDLFPELGGYPDSPVREVSVETGYWRKANHIHRWFVENVQDGTDDCRCYHISRAQLTTLLELCQRVLGFRHLANELLPTSDGFFFGNTQYDDWYYDHIESTITIIERSLALPDAWCFEYQASW